MKHIINTICLTAVLLLFCGGTAFLLLAACSSADRKANPAADELFAEKDSALARADAFSDTIVIKYARGLQVRYLPEGIRVTITNPDPSAVATPAEELLITQPASRFICTTALQLGNFEVLGLEDRIVGMNSLRNLFSPRMKEQWESGHTARIGKEGNFDLETVLATQPDLSSSRLPNTAASRRCATAASRSSRTTATRRPTRWGKPNGSSSWDCSRVRHGVPMPSSTTSSAST